MDFEADLDWVWVTELLRGLDRIVLVESVMSGLGLDPSSVNFGVLPPHFERTHVLSGSIRVCFSNVKDQLMAPLSFYLASLAYDQDLFRRSLTRQDRLLFQGPSSA